ncbi:MAG: LysM peptidoglycan-binding domain-containing protein, partial [Pyrinomonadaceae bacterium]
SSEETIMGDSENSNSAESPDVTYTVQAGDTLSKIAKEYYGDSAQYHAIYEANKDKLDSADDVKVGQELRIPPAKS